MLNHLGPDCRLGVDEHEVPGLRHYHGVHRIAGALRCLFIAGRLRSEHSAREELQCYSERQHLDRRGLAIALGTFIRRTAKKLCDYGGTTYLQLDGQRRPKVSRTI